MLAGLLKALPTKVNMLGGGYKAIHGRPRSTCPPPNGTTANVSVSLGTVDDCANVCMWAEAYGCDDGLGVPVRDLLEVNGVEGSVVRRKYW